MKKGIKKIIMLMMVFCLLFSSTLSAEAASYKVNDLKKTMYSTVTLNVRKGAGTSYKKIGEYYRNDKVSVTGKVFGWNWYRVKYKGNTGYVSGQYLSSKKAPENGNTLSGK